MEPASAGFLRLNKQNMTPKKVSLPGPCTCGPVHDFQQLASVPGLLFHVLRGVLKGARIGLSEAAIAK